MHNRLFFSLTLLVLPLGCATVTPVGARVTGAVRQTQIAAVIHPNFKWPVSSVEGWAAIDRTLTGLASRSKLAVIDPREVDFGKEGVPPLNQAWAQSNLADIASRMNLNRRSILLVQPTIDRQTHKKKLRQGGQIVFAKAADYIVELALEIDGKSAGSIRIKRSLSPMDLAVLEDEVGVWLDLLDEATALLATELKGVNFVRTELPTNLRESFSSVAGDSIPGLVAPLAIPDTLRRLTALDALAQLSKIEASGRDLERKLDEQPGLRVTADKAPLKAGDLVISAETVTVRHPLTIARMRAFGVVHLEVLRDGKIINLILEPQ